MYSAQKQQQNFVRVNSEMNVNTDWIGGYVMEIVLHINQAEQKHLFRELLRLKFTPVDKETLEIAYTWQGTGVLESTKRLRTRVAMNDTREHLDNKIPS